MLKEERYFHFIRERIGMPFSVEVECHASSLVHLGGEKFMAVWFCGSKESRPDTAIYAAWRDENGWSVPEMLVKVGYVAHWNPVLFKKSDGSLLLFFKVGETIATWKTYVMEGDAEGRHWSLPHELVPGDETGGRGPVKNKPIRLADGRILAPMSRERGAWKAFADLSSDDGRTWRCSEEVPVPKLSLDDKFGGNCLGVIQPTAWESEPGQVHMLMRSNNGRIYRTDSTDGGETWSEIVATELPNNNSGIDLAKLEDGSLLLVYNPVEGNWGNRWKIAMTISKDNGDSWCEPIMLDQVDCDQRGGRKSEFSYPAVIPCDGGAAIIYTSHRNSFTFWRLKR